MSSPFKARALRSLSRVLFMAAILPCFAQTAFGQSYPQKTIRLIVPIAAGSGFDATSRMVGERLARKFRQTVIVENLPGAGTTLGAGAIAKAAPDGYTIGLLLSPATIQHSLIGSLPFDVRRDLSPIILIGWGANVLVVNPSLPATSVKELIQALKANPDKFNYASGGNGTPAHMAAELFKLATDTRMVHVPYKSAAPAVQDLVAGRVQVMFGSAAETVPQVRAGKLRALAVVGRKPLSILPGIPSMAEAGYRQVEVPNWLGFAAPAGTPRPIIDLLYAEIAIAIEDPELRALLDRNSYDIEVGNPETFRKQIDADVRLWAEVIRKAGIQGT